MTMKIEFIKWFEDDPVKLNAVVDKAKEIVIREAVPRLGRKLISETSVATGLLKKSIKWRATRRYAEIQYRWYGKAHWKQKNLYFDNLFHYYARQAQYKATKIIADGLHKRIK